MGKLIIRTKHKKHNHNSNPESEPTNQFIRTRRLLNPSQIPIPLYRSTMFWGGCCVGLVTGAISLSIFWYKLELSLPRNLADQVANSIHGNGITIQSNDGLVLEQTGKSNQAYLKINELPKGLINAFIASEDHRFYQHKGIDIRGVGRAILSNLLASDLVEGGSTITQQLARMVFLNQDRSLWRKLREIRIAQKLEKTLTKDKILESYLNLVYLGIGVNGVKDAAWIYFSKDIKDLTLGEMALLAGIAPAPNRFSPLQDINQAKTRRNLVLMRMQQEGFITQKEYQIAINEPIVTQPNQLTKIPRQAHYFTEYIKQKELPQYLSDKIISQGGLTITTTLDYKSQKIAEHTITNLIQERGTIEKFDQAALVSIKPVTGEIISMVGGLDYQISQFNRVTQAQRQPGSTFKLFVYTAAIAAGISPNKSYLDEPLKVDDYLPINFGQIYRGELELKNALAYSANAASVKLLLEVGYQPTIAIARKMGITSKLAEQPALALGESNVNLLELTSAYGTVANQGLHIKPHGIKRITDRFGKIIYQANPTKIQAIDSNTATIMTSMLQRAVQEGTGQAATLPDREVAGKTGISEEAKDILFVGYIPQIVTGVWLGNDNNDPTASVSDTAAQTWQRYMSQVTKSLPITQFTQPTDPLINRQPLINIEPITNVKVVTGNDVLEEIKIQHNSNYSQAKSETIYPKQP